LGGSASRQIYETTSKRYERDLTGSSSPADHLTHREAYVVETVTIAIPVFNGAQYLSEAIESAQEQTRPADELLVWDNASTDQSVEIALGMLPPTSVRASERNMGAVANFNRAAKAATTEWFAWLSSDDRLQPDYLATCLSAATADPSRTRAVLTGVRFIDVEGREKRTQIDLPLGDSRLAIRARHFTRKARWTEAYCLYRTSELMRSPVFTPEYGTDALLTWWFILRGPLLVVDQCLYEYREASERTVEEMAEALMGTGDNRCWRKVRLYRCMWAMSRTSDLSRKETWTARREILLSLFSTAGAGHLSEDLRLRLSAIEKEPRSSVARSLKVSALGLAERVVRARQHVSLSRRAWRD
jgi:glycosyltransferase involved in cell wall biosynthesis